MSTKVREFFPRYIQENTCAMVGGVHARAGEILMLAVNARRVADRYRAAEHFDHIRARMDERMRPIWYGMGQGNRAERRLGKVLP